MKSFFLLILLFSSTSFAEDPVQVIQQISDVQKAVSMKPKCDNCETAAVVVQDCSEELVCNMLRSKKFDTSTTLYENSLGETYPNYFIMSLPFPEKCKASDAFIKKRTEFFGDKSDSFSSSELKENPKALKKFNVSRAKADSKWKPTFEDIRKRLIALVSSFKNDINAKQIQNVIGRIEKVKLRLPTANQLINDEQIADSCAHPNAFFLGEKMEIVVCPGWFDIPKGMMVDMLAHEFGHAFSPCNIDSVVVKKKNGQYEMRGHTEKNKADVVVKSLKFDGFPMKEVVTCFADPKSVDVPYLTAAEAMSEEIKRLEEKQAEFERAGKRDLMQLAKEMIQNKKNDSKDPKIIANTNSCAEGKRSRLLGEVFSDWVASRIVGSAAEEEKDPKRKRELTLESNLYVASKCEQPIKGGQMEAKIKELYKICETTLDETIAEYNYEDWVMPDPHPSSSDRVERMRLAQKSFQNTLNCKLENVRSCP